ncbi:MAG: GIY-YIG nuclease family protein [Alphaproteobacteria bacterium]|nr:GIY-YIG nuclease family protein [Alphaproteobacteria bacterium]
MNQPCAVYMMTNKPRGTLYLGVTSDLLRRVHEHRTGVGSPFTRRYGLTRLVWFETGDWYDGARARERAMKFWRRAWKIELIERANPNWDDLYPTLF